MEIAANGQLSGIESPRFFQRHRSSSRLVARFAALFLSSVPVFAQIITTVAGNGTPGFGGDGGPAASASLNFPTSVASDLSGNLYISDLWNHRIRKVSLDGTIATVAGNGQRGFSGDGGLAVDAALNLTPSQVWTQYTGTAAVDSAANVYIADSGNHRIRKVSTDGTIITVAGNGRAGFSGDGGPATAASLNSPGAVSVDSGGNVYVADTGNLTIRRIDSNGIITTVTDQSGQAVSVLWPTGILPDPIGNLYVCTGDDRVLKISADGTVSTFAGVANGGQQDPENGFGDGGPATSALLASPWSVTVDSTTGNFYIADSHFHRIRRVDPDGTITTVAGASPVENLIVEIYVPGGFSGDGGLATSALLNFPLGVALDAAGNLYIADAANNRVRRISWVSADNAPSRIGR